MARVSLYQVNWQNSAHKGNPESVNFVVAAAGANYATLQAIVRTETGNNSAVVIHANEHQANVFQ